MKYLLAIDIFLLLCCLGASAQDVKNSDEKKDSIKADAKKDGEIVLSDAFMKALDGAFSFSPKQAPLPKQNDLTIEQLHEWVGEPEKIEEQQPDKFDDTYKALKMWEREFYVPLATEKPEIVIPGLKLSKDDGPKVVQFDLQKLAKFIRPKQYRLYKARKKAANLRKDLDLWYPME